MAERTKSNKRAASYHHLYSTKGWKQRRTDQLQREPLCAYCFELGRVVAANVADHIIPHRGDLDLFYDGELQSLCEPCHTTRKQAEEHAGYSLATDAYGFFVDPNHPTNRSR